MELPTEKDIIPLHIVCNSIIIECKGKFLIIKRRPDEVAFPGKWEFVGGKLENGEGIVNNLYREVKEETGLDLDGKMIFLGDYKFKRRDGHYVVGLRFVARTKKEMIKLSQDHTDYAWITLDEAKNYDLIGGLDNELKQAAKALKE